jgi:hypothetical protein
MKSSYLRHFAVLLSLALGACGHQNGSPASATTLAPAVVPSATTTAPAKPVPPKQVSTRLSVALLNPASVTPEGRAAVAAISARIDDCWRAPESPDAPRVSLQLGLNQDGSVQTVTVLDKSAFSKDTAYRAAATTATSAFFKCSPFLLPPAGYAGWKSLALQITPHH